MFRAMSWTLHQRRYRVLVIVTFVFAVGCIAMGTFELHRYHEKVQGNRELKANARATTVPLTPTLAGLTGAGTGSDVARGDAVKYRSVSVTGRYDVAAQTYLGNENQHGREGFFVLTPLRTSTGVLLVARGFVAATPGDARPARIAAPPTGTVTIAGHLYPTQTGSDQLGALGRGELTTVNVVEQAARLGTPVYQSWLSLNRGRAGTSGLTPLPGPDLSNPTGGASDWQLLSYVVQWYVFAVLALLAPLFFSRAEVRDAQRRFLGVDPDEVQFDLVPSRRELAAARASEPGALVRRQGADVARSGPVSPRLARAQKLADRYGRSLGPDPTPVTDTVPVLPLPEPVPRSSRNAPHRANDAHHADYNDYLWQLALADGEAPDVDSLAQDASTPRQTLRSVTEHGPKVIDAAPADAGPPTIDADESSGTDR